MNTAITWATLSTDSSATEQIGQQIGLRLHGNEVIELVSDLGGGKTTFVRGLARGLGSHDHVASPTFTINRQYQGSKLTLQHFDFYRLADPGIVKHELLEAISNPKNVVVIEWPNSVKDVLPDKYLAIEFKIKEDHRKLTFNYPNSLSYLIEGLKGANFNY